MKGTVEVTFLKTSDGDDSDDDNIWYSCPRREVVLCIGDGLALVDVTFPEDDMDTKPWFRRIAPLYRGHRLRAPLVVGLVALRGRSPPDGSRWWCESNGKRGHPRDPGNPIRCVAICVGGSHALVYQPDCYRYKYTGGALPFCEGSKMARLRAFLANRRVTVACIGARVAAEKLAEEWEVDVARPAELTDLFARAFGKEAGVDAVKPPKEPAPDRRWMTRSALLRAEAKATAEREAAEEEDHHSYSKRGRRPVAEVVKGLSLERMAFVALGPEMRLAPWPAEAADAEWGSYYLEKSEWKYAARDAYLCFEIAARCLQKLGAPVGN